MALPRTVLFDSWAEQSLHQAVKSGCVIKYTCPYFIEFVVQQKIFAWAGALVIAQCSQWASGHF